MELLIFKYINCIFNFFPNEKILKSESFRSHDELYLHIKIYKQNSYGETPQLFATAGWPAGVVNNDGTGPGGLRAGLKF